MYNQEKGPSSEGPEKEEGKERRRIGIAEAAKILGIEPSKLSKLSEIGISKAAEILGITPSALQELVKPAVPLEQKEETNPEILKARSLSEAARIAVKLEDSLRKYFPLDVSPKTKETQIPEMSEVLSIKSVHPLDWQLGHIEDIFIKFFPGKKIEPIQNFTYNNILRDPALAENVLKQAKKLEGLWKEIQLEWKEKKK